MMVTLYLLLRICFLGNFFLIGSSSNCSGRYILREKEGVISDGEGDYVDNSHCEWLIDAGSPNKTIHLMFENMGTECSFDFLFIYDGDSYNSRLIASLSGDSPPRPLIAHSGYMLLYLFSDRNYFSMGFDARYKVMDCPWDCSERGVCRNSTCHCQTDYSGVGCQLTDCPNDCGPHGQCKHLSYKRQYCQCDLGYLGKDCSLQVAGEQGQGHWYKVREEEEDETTRSIPGRTSHTSVFINDCIWVFGGFDLNHVLDDLWRYCMSENQWDVFDKVLLGFHSDKVDANSADFPSHNNESISWPKARRGHASDSYRDGFFIYGGILANGSHSNELWHFNTTSLEWSLVAVDSIVKPHRVIGHTLTTVEDYLYLLGGKSEGRVFIDAIFKIDARNPAQWERVLVKGGNYPPKRYVGHSTVYHRDSNTLLVFGGYVQGSGLFSDRTHEMQAFNIRDQYWVLLNNENWRQESMPHDRAFHSAVVMGNYMVVYGGNTHAHSNVEICYNPEMFFYHLGCHVWVNHTYFTGTPMPSKGRFGHSAVVTNGNVMFVFGGYSGMVHGDLLGYKLPSAVADFKCSPGSKVCFDDHANNSSSSSSPNPSLLESRQDHCEVYKYARSCQDDPECVYCHQGRQDGINISDCVHRERVELCKRGDFHDSKERCPGICPALHTCGACVSQGKGVDHQRSSTTYNSPRRSIHIKPCSWCVKEAQCQTRSEPFGTCLHADHTESGIRGWWGGLSANLTSLSQCQKEDFPSGLHWIKYKSPMNDSFPDELVILRRTMGEISTKHHRQMEGYFNLTTRFWGYIHPLNVPTPHGENLTLELGMRNAKVKLYLSTDDTEANKELVISSGMVLATQDTEQAYRPSGIPIFPNTSRGHKYFVEQVTEQVKNSQKTSITLSWNGGLIPLSKHSALTSEFLEPYSNGNCSLSYNCFGCLSDVLCGWCEVARKCIPRNTSAENVCKDESRQHYLITSPSECPSCNHYVECSSCAADPLCEWEIREAHCNRRLRKTNAITNSSQCRLPCHLLTNCGDCIKDKGECTWCENTHTCLPFLELVTRYIYGQCTSWVDNPDLAPGCHSCSNYNTCATCLSEYGCGWCSSDSNPEKNGLCLDGDFAGLDSNHTCSSHLVAAFNISEHEATSWSYDMCPDVNECLLGLHNCHANATCTNTYTSYWCECNRGFVGNGVVQCDKTCYYECVNGFCSGAPHFQCDCNVGWTGDSCDINCGCNNRSTCSQGIGICDACQDLTAGPHCEQCVAGAYVDAMDPEKCIPCMCNGHADKSMGECDNITGECLCTDNTYGFHCEHCMPGFYGNSRKNGKCYLGCDHRTFLTNVTSGALGFHDGNSADDKYKVYCLWVLSAHSSFHTSTDGAGNSNNQATIIVTLEPDLKVECGKDAVYVYDDIPWFIAGVGMGNGKLLGSFCGSNPGPDMTVRAHSGVVTIFFQADLLRSMTQGFNATYKVQACPDSCSGNQICHHDGQCVCKPGFWGQGCQVRICPNNCHQHRHQGHCHNNICKCNLGFGGASCSEKLDPNSLDLHVLTDSRLTLSPWRPQQPIRLPMIQQHKFNHFQKFRPSGSRGKKRQPVEEEEDDEDKRNEGVDYSDTADMYGPSPRSGHTLTQCGQGLLFVYGGMSVEHIILDDMWMYNTTADSWTRIVPPTSINPPGRYYHAAACIPLLKMIYVFGGFETDHSGTVPLASLGVRVNNSLWKFNIESHAWTTESSPPWLPSLAGHTLTHVGLTKLILVGGFSTSNYFNEKVFEYNVSNGLIPWKHLTGVSGAVPIGLYGHTAIFEPATHTIYVFGGYLFRSDHWFVSNELFTLDVKEKSWNMLYPGFNSQWEERVFHTAVSLKDKMVVIGGLTAWGSFASDILVYRFKCTTWHRLSVKDIDTIEQDAISTFGLDAAATQEDIFVFGGFSGTSSGILSRVTLPRDLCASIKDPVVCGSLAGCQICATGDNKTVCYNSEGINDTQPIGCNGLMPKDKRCDERNYKRSKCSRYRTCSQCLAIHPHYKDAGPLCNWCTNCPKSHCIPRNQKCPFLEKCGLPQHTITSVSHCFEYFCPASDCSKCGRLDECLWTRHFERSSETGRDFKDLPIFNWNCVTKNMKPPADSKFESMPPEPCPKKCQEYKTCKSCLRSPGAEGGSKQCYWSESLQECMPPVYVPLHCSKGECGHLSVGNHYKCPDPCRKYLKCADCIATPGCGWCALGGGNGQGVCLPGGVFAPSRGICAEGNFSVIPKTVTSSTEMMSPIHHANAIWSYHQCQPENECKNYHHTCDPVTQDCIDTLKHFRCACKHGYITDKNGNCEPVCHQGCVHGVCYKPDRCRCHFGWVGNNCSVECQCNKHSNCPNVSSTSVCLQCTNNTMGSKCQHCKRNFVGNPENGGRCMPCLEFCNNHTDTCMSQDEYEISQLRAFYSVPKGPTENNAVCIDCRHNTTGHQCERCTSGHFRRNDQALTQPCQECHCNGHSSVCDTDTGENCKCKNNTETNCDAKEESQCWKHQCAQCKEYSLGTPTNGHQCYRQMNVNRDYCFDPNTQKNCDQVPQPLLQGRTVFFAVQPKYLNVNIRITIDVTMGSADIFLSNEKDTFQVFLDREEYFHEVHLDEKYVPNRGLARRSVEESQSRGGTVDFAPISTEDIVVNDEAIGNVVFESKSVRITEEVPDFLKRKSSDTDFYKMSRFESVEKVDGKKKERDGQNKEAKVAVDKGWNDKDRNGMKRKDKKAFIGASNGGKKFSKMTLKHKDVDDKNIEKELDRDLDFIGTSNGGKKISKMILKHKDNVDDKNIEKELARNHDLLLKMKRRKRKRKKEQMRMEKFKKKLGGFRGNPAEIMHGLRLLDQLEYERLDQGHTEFSGSGMWYSKNGTQYWRPTPRRYRRGLFLYNRLFGHVRRRNKKKFDEDEIVAGWREETGEKDRADQLRWREQLQQAFHQQRSRRGLTVTDSKETSNGGRGGRNAKHNKNSRNGAGGSGIRVGEIKAGALNTYITVSEYNSVIVVRDVRFRLVIRLPRDQHDLKSSRFYIIARSRGGNVNNATFGNLYFRQDQPHIDLFVFFSVFFSCFFLFLSVCVLLWKLKQTFDARRTRQMREREMECMASRPFARILVLLEADGTPNQIISTPVPRRARLIRGWQNRGHFYTTTTTTMTTTNNDLNHTISYILPPPSRDLGVVPIAIEPTDDGLAAISTALFQLPGGATAPARMCLGSSLTTRMSPSSNSQKAGNLRRRTSASSC